VILTPIYTGELPGLLAAFASALAPGSPDARTFARIAATADAPARPEARRHAEAVALCRAFAIPALDEPPAAAFSWDGRAIRVADSEASVVIHEVAHYQLCAPARRPLPDFGLGAGPESGRRDEAEAALALPDVRRDVEEGLASLLGILWEAELGHPAIAAFLEQNWLEGGARPPNLAHFRRMLARLRAHGYVDDDGRPALVLRCQDDEGFFSGLVV